MFKELLSGSLEVFELRTESGFSTILQHWPRLMTVQKMRKCHGHGLNLLLLLRENKMYQLECKMKKQQKKESFQFN